ncbi:MAG: hypothetical protein JRJ12_15685 [Deltaproteobacteria bacterium]|nr:hypothetical protein [Deltaproteobacteria bacterium]MBW2072409.1 hypothetical protein [Deltaproteobacteria bacterium]
MLLPELPNAKEVEALKSDRRVRQQIKEELADVFIYALTLTHEFGFDPGELSKRIQLITPQSAPEW